jgi:hypothetical protein
MLNRFGMFLEHVMSCHVKMVDTESTLLLYLRYIFMGNDAEIVFLVEGHGGSTDVENVRGQCDAMVEKSWYSTLAEGTVCT